MDTAKPRAVPTEGHSSSIMQTDRKGAIPIHDPIDNFVLGLLENQQGIDANQSQSVSGNLHHWPVQLHTCKFCIVVFDFHSVCSLKCLA